MALTQQQMLDEQVAGMDTTGGADWASWFQNIAGSAVGAYGSITQQQNQNAFELQKAKIQYLGDTGYYTEGQTGRIGQGSNTMMLLLIGAAVLAVVMLAKD